jgi:hypothetical protein
MRIPTAKGDDLHGGGDFLTAPGTYHLLIDQVKAGLNIKDEPMDGTTVEATVLDGDVAGQAKKKINLTLWDIKMDKPVEEQAVTVRCLTNFFLAANVLQPEQLGQEVDIKPEDSESHQLVVKLQYAQKKENGKWVEDKKFLRINFSDVFHVDDPEVANVPKDQSALKVIDPKYRHDAAWFAFKEKKGIGAGSTSGSSGAKKAGDSDYANW